MDGSTSVDGAASTDLAVRQSAATARPVRAKCRAAWYVNATIVSLLLTAAYYNNTVVVGQFRGLWGVTSFVLDAGDALITSEHKPQQANTGMLPSWRIVTECSTYHVDCAIQLQGRLLEYPFQVKMHNVVGEDGEYDFERIRADDGLPEEWQQALDAFVPPMPEEPTKLKLDGDRLSALVFPPKISKQQSDACYKTRLITTFDQQLDSVLSKLEPVQGIDAIAWTMTDENYSHDMIHDVWEMNNEIVGFRDAFFFLALDAFTLKLACEHGYPVLAAPGLIQGNKKAEAGNEEGLMKELVQSTKFIVSRALVDKGRHFFFFEMDCWFLKSPLQKLRQQSADYLVSVHQWNPQGGNIGVFSVHANERTKEFFRLLVKHSALSPDTHDQIMMNDIANLSQQLHDGEKLQSDLGKDHFGRWKDPIPEKIPKIDRPMSREFFDAHEIAASEHPIPTETSIAIHTLDQKPLLPPHGKKMVSKELGSYTGFAGSPETGGGYYRRSGSRRRFLLTDGRVLGGYSSAQNDVWHDFLQLQWHVAVLVALARRTDRIFILPRIASDFFVLFLWSNLDMESLENLVDVRETNFPSNKKSWFSHVEPFKTVARVALYPGSEKMQDGRLFEQTSASDEIYSWEIEGDAQKVDGMFGLVSASPDLHEAEALFVNPSFTTRNWDFRLGTKDIKRLSQAEKEILYVFDNLRWCGTKVELGTPAIKYNSARDCYGKGKPATRFGKSKS